jgi:hypothetical protein
VHTRVSFLRNSGCAPNCLHVSGDITASRDDLWIRLDSTTPWPWSRTASITCMSGYISTGRLNPSFILHLSIDALHMHPLPSDSSKRWFHDISTSSLDIYTTYANSKCSIAL